MTRKIPLVDLKAQYATIKPEVDAAIARVVENTAFIGGAELSAFEAEFAAFCEAAACAGCNSGTDAIAMALGALGVGPGDEVVTVSMTFIATAEAVSMVGARPVFVDVCDDTLLMDVAKVEAAITERTKALLPVHLYGQLVEMGPLMGLAAARGLKVVEDCAQAHGARQNGRRAGTIGDAAAFSFYPGKNLGAYGDAGAVVTGDKALRDRIAQQRDHGRLTKYEHEFEGQSSRMDGLQAAVLRTKLPHLEDWSAARRAAAARYDALLAPLDGVRPIAIRPGNEPVYHLYVIRVPDRERSLAHLKEAGIGAGVHYPVPLHLQPAYAYLEYGRGAFPVTERAADTMLSLPIFPELTADDQKYVCDRLAESLD